MAGRRPKNITDEEISTARVRWRSTDWDVDRIRAQMNDGDGISSTYMFEIARTNSFGSRPNGRQRSGPPKPRERRCLNCEQRFEVQENGANFCPHCHGTAF